MHDVRAIILKLLGIPEGPFLCRSFTTDSDQDGGGQPDVRILLYNVVRIGGNSRA